MTGKKFVPLSKHPGELADDELTRALASLKDSEVIRTLLMAEIEVVRSGAQRESRTLRNLWYSLVKPSLSRAGILHKQTRGGKAIDWAAKLSVYMTELVRLGVTTYEELSIVDGSRQRRPAAPTVQIITDVPLVGAHYPWLILFTEKDTIWGEVESIASLYGVSAISGGGEPSYACTENTVKAIMESEAYRDEDLCVLTLTDYDPWGYIIAGAQFAQVKELAPDCDVYHERLGLFPSQLTPTERAANAYEPKDQGLEDWYAETGGVDGEPLGLELDALPLSRLRLMFAEGIERYVDLSKRHGDLHVALIDLLACELLKPNFEAERERLQETVKASELWERIVNADIPDNLFRWAARQGLDSIDPLRNTPEMFPADDVRALMRAAQSRAEGDETG